MNRARNISTPYWPIYPFLIGLTPAINLYVRNIESLGTLDLIRPSVAYILLVLVALIFGKSISRTSREAALLGAILVIGAISYGPVNRWVNLAVESDLLTGSFLAVWSVLFICLFASTALLLKNSSSRLYETTLILNIFGLVLFCTSLLPLAGNTNSSLPDQENLTITDAHSPQTHEWIKKKIDFDVLGQAPDFYFIVLDAYARNDVLLSRFDYDNSKMTGWLEKQGFFIGHSSHANYHWTHLSLSSTLNGEYLQTLVPPEFKETLPDEGRRKYLYVKQFLGQYFIRDSRLHRFFRILGYDIIANNSGHSLTRPDNTSISQALFGSINEFEEALLSRSIAQPVIEMLETNSTSAVRQLSKAARVRAALDELVEVSSYRGPKFVFYHILSPHEPFSFNRGGNAIPIHPVYDSSPWMQDKRAMPGYLGWFRINYPINVEGLNHHIRFAIEEILEATNNEAVIVIQSDHGPSLGLTSNVPLENDLVERFGILNAIYLPEKYRQELSDSSISAVNTFPMLLNAVFGLQIKTQEDQAFYSLGGLEFLEVTDAVRGVQQTPE